jgi:hypothetical protein
MTSELEKIIDQMYSGYMEIEHRTDKKKKHPSRKEFGKILKYCQAWNITVRVFAEKTANNGVTYQFNYQEYGEEENNSG